jgi:hypothetical protein
MRVTTSQVHGVVFAKENGIAFINLRGGKQIWIPSKNVCVGDTAYVTVAVERKE